MRLWEGAWPKDAVISHFRLKNALEEEEPIRARVTLVHADDVCELQSLARAHGYKDTRVALVLVDVAKAPADHKVAWLQLHLKDKAPQLRKVALVPLVSELPDIPSIVVKATKPVSAQEAVTVRCTIRECCLDDPSRWTKFKSKPEPHVLQTICPEGRGLIRTYGWSDLRDASGKVEGVTGFLRVTKTLAEEAVSTMSGKGGVFVDNLAQQGVRLPVAWIARLHDESAEEYFRRARSEAGQKGLAFRRGGGSYLGVRGGTVTDKDTWNRMSQWRLHGVPAGWSGDQLCRWLQDNGWKEPEVVMPPRQRLGWVVRAVPPSEGVCHGIELDDHKIVTLSRYLYQHARPMSEVIQNPGSGFPQREPRTDKAQQASPTGTRVEAQDKEEGEDVDMTTTTDKRKAEELERTDSPARARARTMSKNTVELSRKNKETPWGFHTVDAGGDGDCGYRALAAAFKLAAGESPEKAKASAAKHGASLRARAATWIKKKGKFKDSFAVDDKWTEQMEAGPIPKTYDEWVESCARPRRWIDGPGYIAAATVLERRILVQKFLDGRWCRVALYEPHESDPKANMTARKHPVLPLFLRDQHLTTVIPCSLQAWPEEWAEPIEKVLEKQADMRAAGLRVRSEGSASSLFTGTVSPATNRSRPSSHKSGSRSSGREARVILPVAEMCDDVPPAASCQDTPVRSERSKRTAQVEKSLFAGSISTEMASMTRATANTSVSVQSCVASGRSKRSKRTAQVEKSLFAGSISTEMASMTRATANTSVSVQSCVASVSSKRSKRTAQVEKSLFAGFISTEMASMTRATANTSESVQSCVASVSSKRSKSTAQVEKSLFAGSISTEMASMTRATANTSENVQSCVASDEIPDFLLAARDPGGDEHRWTCRICHHTLSAASGRKLTIARSNHLTRRHAGATGDRSLWIRHWAEICEVTAKIPKEQRAWSCPLCDGGLPFMSNHARRGAVQKHINQSHEGETLASIARRRQTGRGAARESGLARSGRNALARSRGEDVHSKNGHEPVAIRPVWGEWTGTEKARADRCGVYLTCAKCFAAHTTMRRTPCPGAPRSAQGKRTLHRRTRMWWRELRRRGDANPQMLANVWKRSVLEMDEYFGFTEY